MIFQGPLQMFHFLFFLFKFFFFFFFFFFGPHLQHMVSRLGVQSELHLLAHATATATWDLSCVCDLHHSL